MAEKATKPPKALEKTNPLKEAEAPKPQGVLEKAKAWVRGTITPNKTG